MSDYDPTRGYPPNHLRSGEGSGTGLLWLLVAVAVLGGIVLLGTFGGGAAVTDLPGGAGADPVATETAPAVPEPQAVIE